MAAGILPCTRERFSLGYLKLNGEVFQTTAHLEGFAALHAPPKARKPGALLERAATACTRVPVRGVHQAYVNLGHCRSLRAGGSRSAPAGQSTMRLSPSL